MATKLPSNNKRMKAATRALEYRAVGKSWRDIFDLVKQEHPDCWNTAVPDAIYRLDHLDVEDWLPKDPVTPEPVQRYEEARWAWIEADYRPWDNLRDADGQAFRTQHKVRSDSIEFREWYKERTKSKPVFVPPEGSVKDYRDLP